MMAFDSTTSKVRNQFIKLPYYTFSEEIIEMVGAKETYIQIQKVLSQLQAKEESSPMMDDRTTLHQKYALLSTLLLPLQPSTEKVGLV